jgi:Protein of unknown function (DUF2917)
MSHRRESIMREIRYFESEYAEAPARLVAIRPSTIAARAGELWVTLDERPGDYWLKPGDALALETGDCAWVGAGSKRTTWMLSMEAAKAHVSRAVWAARVLHASWRWLSADGGQRDECASARLRMSEDVS